MIVTPTVLGVGTTRMLLRGSARNLKEKLPMDFILSLIQHFPKVAIGLPEKSTFPSRLANPSHWIMTGEHTSFDSRGQSYPTAKLWNGVCVSSKGVSGGFTYH